MDTKLSSHDHVLANKTKALKIIGRIASPAGSVLAAKFPRMRQILLAVVILQLIYACSVWYIPQREKKHLKSLYKLLVSIQHQANMVITGAYKATLAPGLEIETYTPPIEQKLDQLTCISVFRIKTSPLYSAIIATKTPPCALLSPLEPFTAQ